MACNIKISCIHSLKNYCMPWHELSCLNMVLGFEEQHGIKKIKSQSCCPQKLSVYLERRPRDSYKTDDESSQRSTISTHSIMDTPGENFTQDGSQLEQLQRPPRIGNTWVTTWAMSISSLKAERGGFIKRKKQVSDRGNNSGEDQ